MMWKNTTKNNSDGSEKKYRIGIGLSYVVFAVLLIGCIVTFQQNKKAEPEADIWQKNSMPLGKLGDVFQRYHDIGFYIYQASTETDKNKIAEYIVKINENCQTIEEELDFCAKSAKTIVEVRLYKNAVIAINKYWEHLNTVENLLLQNKYAEAKRLMVGDMAKAATNYLNILDTWINYNLSIGT